MQIVQELQRSGNIVDGFISFEIHLLKSKFQLRHRIMFSVYLYIYFLNRINYVNIIKNKYLLARDRKFQFAKSIPQATTKVLFII